MSMAKKPCRDIDRRGERLAAACSRFHILGAKVTRSDGTGDFDTSPAGRPRIRSRFTSQCSKLAAERESLLGNYKCVGCAHVTGESVHVHSSRGPPCTYFRARSSKLDLERILHTATSASSKAFERFTEGRGCDMYTWLRFNCLLRALTTLGTGIKVRSSA